MTALRTAAQQALEAMLNFPDDISDEMFESITALKAALAEPQPNTLHDWVFKRNADGSIGIFAPPPKPGESQRTSDCVGTNQRDLNELLGKLADHMAALAEHDKNLAGFKERKANWDIRAPRSPRDLQCKLAEETQERDRQRREYEEQRLAALAEPVQDVKGCDVCEHPLYAGIKCRVCGRVTQAKPMQDPVAWMNTEDGFCTLDSPVEGIDVMSQWVPLYDAPPQRKPLTREEAIELWADKSDGPSNSEIVLYCRAIERAHGIGGDE